MTKLCVIYGDGIGKEVVPAAVTILQALIPDLELKTAQAGWNVSSNTALQYLKKPFKRFANAVLPCLGQYLLHPKK